MRGNEFLDKMEQIDPAYIEEAGQEFRKKRTRLARWGAVAAACLCLAVAGVYFYGSGGITSGANTEGSNGGEVADVQMAPWDALESYQQFGNIEYGGLEYLARSAEIPSDRVGEMLGTVVAVGYAYDDISDTVDDRETKGTVDDTADDNIADDAANANQESEEKYCNVTVYEISGISTEYAVAVQYEGTDVYYAAVNSGYCPKTLGDFIEDLDLENTLVFDGLIYIEDYSALEGDEGLSLSGIAGYQVDVECSAQIWSLLLSELSAANVYSDLDNDQPSRIMVIGVSLPLLGYENRSLEICEDGYIITNLLDTGKQFCVGEENTKEFMEYVIRECEAYEQDADSDLETEIPE